MTTKPGAELQAKLEAQLRRVKAYVQCLSTRTVVGRERWEARWHRAPRSREFARERGTEGLERPGVHETEVSVHRALRVTEVLGK